MVVNFYGQKKCWKFASADTLNATPPSGNQTSAQHKKVKYYNLSISNEKKEETVLFLMDKFTIFLNRLNVKVYFHVFSNCFYGVLSLLRNYTSKW